MQEDVSGDRGSTLSSAAAGASEKVPGESTPQEARRITTARSKSRGRPSHIFHNLEFTVPQTENFYLGIISTDFLG